MYAGAIDIEATPHWQGHTGRRLLASCTFSAVLLFAVLLNIRMPAAPGMPDLAELVVTLLPQSVPPAEWPVQQVPEAINPADPQREPAGTETGLTQGPLTDAPADRAATDWYAFSRERLATYGSEAAASLDFRGRFESRMQAAGDSYAPSVGRETPIWENTGKDAMGRTVLVHGDCHRVLNDPNVGSRDAFLTFGQYLVFCATQTESQKPAEWVPELRRRYAYLPDS